MSSKINLNFNIELHDELVRNILPFWMTKMVDYEHGGFYGQIKGNDLLIPDAPKGGILNARILWTFSSAYRLIGDSKYLEMATRAKEYIFNFFFDRKFGGTYWSLNHSGDPLDTKKQIYAQAFFVYALSEYYQITGDETCKIEAINLFNLIEKYSYDSFNSGYLEAFNQEWTMLDDLRLSSKDANEKKTMNTHLHILEAYTNLYRVWKDKRLAIQLKSLICVFIDKIIDKKTSHLNLFFDENWNCKSATTSYGHDIECSWLLYEAAHVLDNTEIKEKVSDICIQMVDSSLEGLQKDGSIIYEKDNSSGHIDYDRHWWPQAEAVVGFYCAFELTKDLKYFAMAQNTFNYIRINLTDRNNGEWYWGINADGSINHIDDKAGFWKCPYHNSRMCIEIMNRLQKTGTEIV